MPSKTKKVVPAIKMIKNPLTRKRKRNRLLTRKSGSRSSSTSCSHGVKMYDNPVRDCGSIGGGKKKRKKKSCNCSTSWFF